MPVGGRWTAARVAPFACAAVVLVVALAARSAQPAGVFWDDGVYLISARSLAAGEGYAFAHLPGSPPAVHFPPAWPALLAVVWAVAPDFPGNLAVLRVVNPLLAAVAAGLACAYGVRRLALDWRLSSAAVLLFSMTLPVLVLGSVLFAEPLFLVGAAATLIVADRAVDSGGMRLAVVAGLLAGLTALTRSAGLTLVPAIVAALLLSRRTREAWMAAGVAIATVLPWQWWSAARAGELAEPLRGNYGPYVAWLAEAVRERGLPFVAAVARENFVAIERSFAVVFFPAGLREVRPLLLALLAVVAGLGFIAAWRRSRALCLWAAAYGALVLVWPYAPDRFAWAVWPLAGLVLAVGAYQAWTLTRDVRLPPAVRASAGLVLSVAVVAAAGLAFYSARGASRGWVDVAQRRNAARLSRVAEWVVANTPPDAVIAADGEPLVHLYTGRRVVPVHVLSPDEYLSGTPTRTAADNLRALLTTGGADFAVLSAGSSLRAAAAMLDGRDGFPRLIPVDTLPGGGVAYRVDAGRN